MCVTNLRNLRVSPFGYAAGSFDDRKLSHVGWIDSTATANAMRPLPASKVLGIGLAKEAVLPLSVDFKLASPRRTIIVPSSANVLLG
jgi:hypothetical protein